MKKIIAMLCTAVVLFFAFLFTFEFPFFEGREEVRRSFVIASGETKNATIARLASEGFIPSALLFKIYSRFPLISQAFKFGEYELGPSWSMARVYRHLVSGTQKLYTITIPEGLSLTQTAKLFAREGFMSEEVFLRTAKDPAILEEFSVEAPSLEGYLFPDTYKFLRNDSPSKMIRLMARHFFDTLATIYPPYLKMTKTQLRETIVLASLIEGEYRVESEAPLMASVFTNRIDKGIKLQSCASVIYAMVEEYSKPRPARLYYKDLEIKSAYNTYDIKGLPPSPINNPGKIALLAAFHPSKTDYLYFVVKNPKEGTHTFSRTFMEHDAAKLAYLKQIDGF